MPKQKTRQFHLGAIVSITTGFLMPPPTGYKYPIECVYDILNFMTGDDLQTLALGRAADECRPYLYEQLPFTREITISDDLNETNYREFLQALVEQYGEFHPVHPIHPEDHEVLDPLEDLLRLRPNVSLDNVISFDLEPDEPSDIGDISWKVD